MHTDETKTKLLALRSRLLQLLICQGIGCLFTLLSLLLMAALLCSKDYDHSMIETFSFLSLGIGCFSAGLSFGAFCQKKGFLMGGISGFTLALLVALIGIFISPEAVSGLLIRLVIGLLSGLVGGVLGVNLKFPKKHR